MQMILSTSGLHETGKARPVLQQSTTRTSEMAEFAARPAAKAPGKKT